MTTWVIACRYCDFKQAVTSDIPPVMGTQWQQNMRRHSNPRGRLRIACPGSLTPGNSLGKLGDVGVPDPTQP